MAAPKLFLEDWSIEAKLNATFGVSRQDLIGVVRDVVAARADAVEDDPLSAAGQFAYIYGTRSIRQALRRAGWIRHRQDNLELAKHPERDILVAYQSVDLACSQTHNPQAISGKGAGAERVIDTQSLFSAEEMSGTARDTDFQTGMWFFCVSVVGDEVRAELSMSGGLEAGNFKPFIERIFVIRQGEWDSLRGAGDGGSDEGPVEFKPSIARK
jgi:hypothetical protein